MKRVINVSLLIITIITCTVVNAAEKFSVEISNAAMVNVSLSKVSDGDKLSLKDYSGVVLYNVTLDEMPLYNKFFNFNNVPNGIYFIETEEAHTVKVTPIIKNESGVSLIKNSAITIFKPQIHVDKSVVKLMFNNTAKEPVTVKVYDNESRLLDEVIGNNEEILKKVYDFSKMPKGEYTFYVGQDGRSFVKKVSI